MKGITFAECGAALLLAVLPIVQSSPKPPVNTIEPRDFSVDLRNFNQIQHLLHNLRSRIGIPFSAMQNVGLSFQQTLEVQPLDLILLPTGYCFSCSTPSHSALDHSKSPDPFRNEMVELDETQLLVACTDDTIGGKPDEWPLVKACPGQEKLLREFLFDVCTHGSRLAIPKARLEKAPIFQVNKRTCMPMNPKQSTCSTTPLSTQFTSTTSPTTFRTETTTSRTLRDRLQDLISSISQYRSLSGTVTALTTASTESPQSTTILSSASVTGLNATNREPISVATSSIAFRSSLTNVVPTISPDRRFSSDSTYDTQSTSLSHEDDQAQSTVGRMPFKPTTAQTSFRSNSAATLNSVKGPKVLGFSSTSRSIPISTKISSSTWSSRIFIPTSKYLTEPWDPNDSEARYFSAMSAYWKAANAAQHTTSQSVSSSAPNLDDDEFFYPRVEPFDEEDHQKAVSVLLAWRSSQDAMAASISSSIDHSKAMSVMGAWQSSHDAELNAIYAASSASAASASLASVKGTNVAITTSAPPRLPTGQKPSSTPRLAPRTTAVDAPLQTFACTLTSIDDEDLFEEISDALTPVIPTKTKGTIVTPRAVCFGRGTSNPIWLDMFVPTKIQRPRPGPTQRTSYNWVKFERTGTVTETAGWVSLAHLNYVLTQAGLATTSEWVTTITFTRTTIDLAPISTYYDYR